MRFIKVLDFGLVAHLRQAPSDVMLTPPEHAIGTPAFMAPEVAQGQGIDGRSDLYGLGCVAYWLVTGRQVFEGSGFLEVVAKHLHVEPDPPSYHSREDLPPELDALILMCLEKKPERRPASAREVARCCTGASPDAWDLGARERGGPSTFGGGSGAVSRALFSRDAGDRLYARPAAAQRGARSKTPERHVVPASRSMAPAPTLPPRTAPPQTAPILFKTFPPAWSTKLGKIEIVMYANAP